MDATEKEKKKIKTGFPVFRNSDGRKHSRDRESPTSDRISCFLIPDGSVPDGALPSFPAQPVILPGFGGTCVWWEVLRHASVSSGELPRLLPASGPIAEAHGTCRRPGAPGLQLRAPSGFPELLGVPKPLGLLFLIPGCWDRLHPGWCVGASCPAGWCEYASREAGTFPQNKPS